MATVGHVVDVTGQNVAIGAGQTVTSASESVPP